jgi:putative CocE/NonD family hydrolase
MRSPYGVPPDSKFLNHPVHAALVRDGYIWVFQNLRGRFASEGTFVMDRPPRNANDPLSIDESSDAYDAIEWLVHHVPGHNGRVGMTGTSYDALTAVLATVDPHPALKAVVEEATPADQFIGDDFHHNGAFRLAYAFEYVALLESSKSENTRFQFDDRDIFDFHVKVGPLSNIDKKYFHGKMPTWNDFVAHPNNDEFWQERSFDAFVNASSVPILHCVGWWDQEDFYGPLHAYARIEKNDHQNHNQIVIGPWNHGGWYSEGRKLLSVDFGSATGEYYRDQVKAPWLARYLHETGEGVRDEATIFVTGANTWRSFKSWPPKDLTSEKKLYLHAGNTLSFEAPSPREKAKFSKYVSDPEDPVPFLPRPIDPLFSGPQWSTWQAVDQTFLEHRTDVLSFSTPPLTSDLTIAGNLRFELFASTTGSDSDWVVKVIDVYPASEMKSETRPTEEGMTEKQDRADGYQLMIVGEVLRGRYRKSFVVPSPITPNKTIPYTINLHSHAHTFRRGHRMMIQVQSTWFPLIDRNPQTYVSNI